MIFPASLPSVLPGFLCRDSCAAAPARPHTEPDAARPGREQPVSSHPRDTGLKGWALLGSFPEEILQTKSW